MLQPSRTFIAMLMSGTLLLAACGGGASSSTETGSTAEGTAGGSAAEETIDPNGTFRYVFVQNPTSLDPARSGNTFDMIYLRLVYDQLIYRNDAGELEPMLATEWELVDEGAALEMTLRDDVTFTDGETFDASVVKANLDRVKTLETSIHKGALARIESIEVVDDYRVRFNLNGPGGNLPDLLSSNVGSMVSPAALDDEGLDQNPVGSGMAKLVEYVPGQVARFERNEDYWDPEAAKAAKYEVFIQTASPTRLNMLTTGQAELTYLLPQDGDAAEAAGLNVAPSVSTSTFSLLLSAGKEGLNDPRVREAVDLAIDRQAIIDGVFFGAGEPLVQALGPDHWAHHPDFQPNMPEYEYNPTRASELLAEAGFPDGLDLEMVVPALDDHRAIAEALGPMLGEVGIRVTTQVIEPATAGVTFYAQQEGDLMPGLLPPILDPTNSYQGNLPGQYSNPWENTSEDFVEAWEASLEGTTREERLPGVHRMIEEADRNLRNRITIFLFEPPSAWTDNVVLPEGYQPAYAPTFRGVGVTGN